MHWAFALGRPQVASCLLHFGADLNIRSENGDTPFDLADKFGTGYIMRQIFDMKEEKPDESVVHDEETFCCDRHRRLRDETAVEGETKNGLRGAKRKRRKKI